MGAQELIRTDIEGYLAQYQQKELLRLVAVGSVDDGKSTLIGRLLFDTGGVYDDQLAAVKKATSLPGEEIDFSLLTDGLAAEREQGITIDVAYRYFSTDRRKFIVADTPGHVQYTRNMATGASTANVAIILVDARLGVLQQSRRHAQIAALLGIPHLAVCVNKMDLVGWDEETFTRISRTFREFGDRLGFKDIALIPVSALKGANIVHRATSMGWYAGPTVLEYLEQVPVSADRNLESFRYPVQTVLRPDLNYRGFAAQLASGRVNAGDEVVVLPSGTRTRVKAIDTWGGQLAEAVTPQSVVLRLEHEVDVSRGDMLVHPHDLPTVARTFDAHLVWMNEKPLDTGKTYLVKHTTRTVRAQVDSIQWKRDMDTLADVPAEGLGLNDLGRVRITCHKPLFFDPYVENRATGAFIVIDSLTNDTVAAGMIIGDGKRTGGEEAAGRRTQVSERERRERLGQRGFVIALGVADDQRLELAFALERRLFDLGVLGAVVADLPENEARATAEALAKAGLVAIVAVEIDSRSVNVATTEADEDAIVKLLVERGFVNG